MKLRNKVALVTGGARGIGFAIARRYVAVGGDERVDLGVVVACLTVEQLQPVLVPQQLFAVEAPARTDDAKVPAGPWRTAPLASR